MDKHRPESKNGCLWFILTGIFSFFGFIFIHNILRFSAIISLFVAIIISIIFVNILSKGLHKRAMFRNGIVLFILIFSVKLFFGFLANLFNDLDSNDYAFTKEEGVKKVNFFENNDSIIVYQSNRNWKDNFGNSYQGSLKVRESDFIRLQNNTANYNYTDESTFWGGLYKYLERTDAPSLDLLVQTFEQIQVSGNLNRMEFAEMIVSCIQDIPYSLVLTEACFPADKYDDSIQEILQNCPECCIGNVLYGIQSPVSFLQNLKGDCDTRTVIIYSVLKHFNYDVAILNSNFYRHSIIGLNLPVNGQYKIRNGKRYVVWETTAKYYTVGILPEIFNDITHWEIVLTSK